MLRSIVNSSEVEMATVITMGEEFQNSPKKILRRLPPNIPQIMDGDNNLYIIANRFLRAMGPYGKWTSIYTLNAVASDLADWFTYLEEQENIELAENLKGGFLKGQKALVKDGFENTDIGYVVFEGKTYKASTNSDYQHHLGEVVRIVIFNNNLLVIDKIDSDARWLNMSKDDIGYFRDEMSDKKKDNGHRYYKNSTINRHLTSIVGLIEFAAEKGYRVSGLGAVKKSDVKAYIDRSAYSYTRDVGGVKSDLSLHVQEPEYHMILWEDYEKLVDSCDTGKDRGRNLRNRLIISCPFLTGLRLEEIANLRLFKGIGENGLVNLIPDMNERYDFTPGYVEGKGSGRKIRKVMYPNEWLGMVEEYRDFVREVWTENTDELTDFAWVGKDGKELKQSTIQKIFYRNKHNEKIKKKYGKKALPHVGRHTFASYYLYNRRAGIDFSSNTSFLDSNVVVMLSALLGHSRVSTTMEHYIHNVVMLKHLLGD